MEQTNPDAPFTAARYIKEIGRGKDGARNLAHADAQCLYAAMLDGRVSALELGAIVLALRIKGETPEEIAGFMAAAEAHVLRLAAPAGPYAPLVIPSYNGARKKANLTALLALLVARRGVPVLVHGVLDDPGRVTTAEIFTALGLPLAHDSAAAAQQFAAHRPAFMPVAALAPALQRLLDLRRVLGVRNSTHTLVKLLQPFTAPALRLCAYTHPEYFAMLQHYLAGERTRGDAFLMRGTEGEVVASTGRAQQIDWYHQGECTTLVHTHASLAGTAPDIPADAAGTAAWIEAALAGTVAIPHNIAEQVEHCVLVAQMMRERG